MTNFIESIYVMFNNVRITKNYSLCFLWINLERTKGKIPLYAPFSLIKIILLDQKCDKYPQVNEIEESFSVNLIARPFNAVSHASVHPSSAVSA